MMKDTGNGKGFKIAIVVIVIVAVISGAVVIIKQEAFKNPKLADYIYCYQEDNVKNCVRGFDDISFCKYKETQDVKCTTKNLKEKQFVITQQ